MPLHLNSITNDSQNSEPLAWMLQKGMDECDSIFITEDQKYFHIRAIFWIGCLAKTLENLFIQFYMVKKLWK